MIDVYSWSMKVYLNDFSFLFFFVKKSLAQLCNVTPVELSAEKDTKKSIETSIFKLNHDY